MRAFRFGHGSLGAPGFVLVGIPIYYITQRGTDIQLPGKLCEFLGRHLYEDT